MELAYFQYSLYRWLCIRQSLCWWRANTKAKAMHGTVSCNIRRLANFEWSICKHLKYNLPCYFRRILCTCGHVPYLQYGRLRRKSAIRHFSMGENLLFVIIYNIYLYNVYTSFHVVAAKKQAMARDILEHPQSRFYTRVDVLQRATETSSTCLYSQRPVLHSNNYRVRRDQWLSVQFNVHSRAHVSIFDRKSPPRSRNVPYIYV